MSHVLKNFQKKHPSDLLQILPLNFLGIAVFEAMNKEDNTMKVKQTKIIFEQVLVELMSVFT